jgi:hypothetical protein
MFSHAQQKALDLLDKYFAETPFEKIQADIDYINSLEFEGKPAEEYFATLHKYYPVFEDYSIPSQKQTQSCR